MARVKAIGREIIGLFVEDVWFTVALAVWVAVVAAARPWWQAAQPLGAVALFVGFALILADSVVRAARRD
ncbi:MAG TPA: hypothetical protein VGM07_16140 [Stellaceae bacterium]|jgi:hypothetical protein